MVLKNGSDVTAYLGLGYVRVLCGIFQNTRLPLTSSLYPPTLQPHAMS